MSNPTEEEKVVALEKSIKHWEKDHLKLLMFGGDFDFLQVFGADNCDLCKLHDSDFRDYDHADDCGICPLNLKGLRCGTTYINPWSRARVAHYDGDKQEFFKAQDVLVKAMKDALQEVIK